MAQGYAREGKWRGNWRMEWEASTLHTTSEHGLSSIITADAHTSAASSRLNWSPCRSKWTLPFRRKAKSGFCACAITFQTQSTTCFNDKYFWILLTMSTYFSNVWALVMDKYFDYRMGTQFLGAFEKPQKATIIFVISVRPSARNNSAPARRIFMKIFIWVFSNICREASISINIWRE
jgi:hypothetical protein